MNIKDAILATIASEHDQILTGRTQLQKKLYFVSVLMGQDFDFRPHYYGPYSPTVAYELSTLVDADFIVEKSTLLAAGGPFGERRRYTYCLDPSTRDILEDRSDEIKPYLKALKRINSHQVAEDPRLFPVAAKVHLIVSEGGSVTVDQIKQRAEELGWSLTDADINLVTQYLKHLDLVSAA